MIMKEESIQEPIHEPISILAVAACDGTLFL